MKNKKNKNISKKIADFIVQNPLELLFLSIIFVCILIPSLSKVKSDFGYRIWFYPTDHLIVEFDKFEREFGNDDSVAFYVYNKNGIFNKKSLNLIKKLTNEIWNITDVIGVDSITNYQWTHASGDDVIIENMIPNENLTEKIIKDRMNISLNHKVIPNYVINSDATVAMIFGKLKPYLKSAPDYEKIVISSRKLLKKFKTNYPEYIFHMNGMGAINDAFREVAVSDMKAMVPLLIGGIILLLILSFRRFSALLIPFLVIIASLLVTFGFAGLVGIKFNNVVSMIPQIIIAISIADTVHILTTYFQYRRMGLDKKEATRKSLIKNIKPTFLTSFSTSLGFISFSTAKLVPIASMGYLAAFGTMGAWIFTMIIVGPLMALISVKVPIQSKKNKESRNLQFLSESNYQISNFSSKSINLISSHKKKISLSFIFMFFMSLWIGSLNVINSNPFDYFSKKVPIRKANDFALNKIGGFIGPEISLDSGINDGIKDPLFLKKVEKLQLWIESENYVSRVISIIDILKSMNRSFNGDDQKYYKLPDTKAKIAQLLFLYTMSLPQGMDLNDRINLTNKKMRLTVIWNLQSSAETLSAIDEINNKIKELGLVGIVTGKIPLYQRMNGHVVSAFITSISLAVLLVGLLMIFIFKSWKIGLISMIPNIIPLGFGAALMTILGKPIDVGTVLVTSVCLGIAVDDTIHFLANYYKFLTEGDSIDIAIKKVMTSTGPALISTTLILVLSFGVFIFADFIPNVNFGILTALVLSSALIVDLIFLPALLLWVDEEGGQNANKYKKKGK